MFKVFAVISFIIAGFMGFLLLKGYANDVAVWIAFAGSIFNGILYATIGTLKDETESQGEELKWLAGKLTQVEKQLSDIKKNK